MMNISSDTHKQAAGRRGVRQVEEKPLRSSRDVSRSIPSGGYTPELHIDSNSRDRGSLEIAYMGKQVELGFALEHQEKAYASRGVCI